MSQLCHIGRMPNEILARILESLQEDDVISCRLVNKQLGAIATRQFAKRSFTKLCVSFSSHGLKALVDICAHPELGIFVRGIGVSPIRASANGIRELTKSFKKSLKTGSPEEVDDAYKFLQSHIEACRDEHMLEKSGQAIHLIATALVSLRRRGVSADISIHNGHYYKTIGWRQAYRERGYIMERKTQEHMNATIHIMFHAIFRSGCKVSNFQIEQHYYHDHQLDGLKNSIDLADSMLHAFVGLQSLELAFKKMPKQKTLDSLDLIFGHMHSLERLRIELDCNPDSNGLNGRVATEDVLASDTLLGSHSSECLRQIELKNVCISKKRLVKLLKASQDCLEKLDLYYVCLRRGSWYSVLSWIVDNLHLNLLKLFALFEIDESDPDEEGYYASAWNDEKLGDRMLKFLGEDTVDSGLSELLSVED